MKRVKWVWTVFNCVESDSEGGRETGRREVEKERKMSE